MHHVAWFIIKQWIDECVSEWMNEWMNEWIIESLHDYAATVDCQENNGGCSIHATCTDTPGGGVTCTCNAGYTGNGHDCEREQNHWIFFF